MECRTLTDRKAVREAIQTHGRAWQEAYDGLLPASVLERVTVSPDADAVDAWMDRLPGESDPGFACGIAVRDTIRGYAFVRWGETKPFVRPHEAGLKEIYVHPDLWGGGLGTELLVSAREHLPPEIEGLALEVLADNERARRFYESRGFVYDGTHAIDIDGETYETLVYRMTV